MKTIITINGREYISTGKVVNNTDTTVDIQAEISKGHSIAFVPVYNGKEVFKSVQTFN